MLTFAAMAETLTIHSSGDKSLRYEVLIPQLRALIDHQATAVANVGNAMAALHQTFSWLWIGVYMVENGELVLGPFQGPIACTRIARGKGVCGKAWEQAQTIIVPDVEAFPGHIACSSESRSEIVVPIWKDDNIIGVIDADSQYAEHFDLIDQQFLEKIAVLIADCYG